MSGKEKNIEIRGANVNNLKNIDLDIPRNKLIVITGLSGSGKSSLAFDTLYAEGQRRYVESLSSYARQFMGRMRKPNVKSVKGIPPAIAIEQQILSKNPRSTVGTVTEIYEYLKLLFARIGQTFSPISGTEVKRHDVKDVISYIQNITKGQKVYILAPIIVVEGRTLTEQIKIYQQQGFSRLFFKKSIYEIEDFLKNVNNKLVKDVFIMIDRFKSDNISSQNSRLYDAIQMAFAEGKGRCSIQIEGEDVVVKEFSNTFEADGMSFEEPSVNLFSFNNPYGACKFCSGTGRVEGVSADLVFPNRQLSVAEDAVACWHGEVMSEWKRQFIKTASKLNFPIYRAIDDLTKEEYELLWYGNPKEGVYGITQFFEFVAANTYKIQFRVMQARYRGFEICPECKGSRLRADAQYVKVRNLSISQMLSMSISNLKVFFDEFQYESEYEQEVAKILIRELQRRVSLLDEVGLGYLTLDRNCSTLSGGESQRINLATSLGSSLVGSLYILDEPSIGLHPRDTQKLIGVLKKLRDIGNTVVVVEHDEEIIRAADYIVDIGPKAGQFGGEVMFSGNFKELLKLSDNLTAQYLRGMVIGSDDSLIIPVPKYRRKWRNYIEINGARENNLKNVDVKIPLECFTVITGVSGSGKSSLITDILFPAVSSLIERGKAKQGRYRSINADISKLSGVVLVDQDAIGRSTRSNPATYIKIFDYVRELYAAQPLSKQRNYKSGFFSFNVPGGRCEECEGEGVIRINMQFMADVEMVCPSCSGKRFRDDALDVKVAEKDINDVLNMTVLEAMVFFSSLPSNDIIENIMRRLKALNDVGLEYLVLGQQSATLSGGEAQRMKLACFLIQDDSKQHQLFIFDEPTTGLHFHDIHKLYDSFNRLVEHGNSVVVIEHNMEIVKCADWIIDLGPEGGEYGGKIVFEGTPEDLLKCEESYTSKFLKDKL